MGFSAPVLVEYEIEIFNKETIKEKLYKEVDVLLEENWNRYSELRNRIEDHGKFLREAIKNNDKKKAIKFYDNIIDIYNNLINPQPEESFDIPELKEALIMLCKIYIFEFNNFDQLHQHETEHRKK